MKLKTITPRIRQFSGPAILLLGLLLMQTTGCQSVPEGSPVMKQQALSFTPPAGKAYVYVVRPSRFEGHAVLFGVSLDYQAFGMLENSSYIFAAVPPGEHALRGSSSTPSVLGGGGVGRLESFTAEAGKSYFFTVNPPGWTGGLRFEQISEADGKGYVQKLKLSGDNRFEYQNKTSQP